MNKYHKVLKYGKNVNPGRKQDMEQLVSNCYVVGSLYIGNDQRYTPREKFEDSLNHLLKGQTIAYIGDFHSYCLNTEQIKYDI